MSEQLVGNRSKAYGYNYASLGDIALQGFVIPKMRTVTTEYGEFVQYYDSDLNEWQMGARIVIPEMKGSNSAQCYGSALTYARRYTVQMALGLACDEDKKLEKQMPEEEKKPAPKKEKKPEPVKVEEPEKQIAYISKEQVKAIADRMQTVFGNSPDKADAFKILTGYSNMKIPSDHFEDVMQRINLTFDESNEILAEIEKKKENK